MSWVTMNYRKAHFAHVERTTGRIVTCLSLKVSFGSQSSRQHLERYLFKESSSSMVSSVWSGPHLTQSRWRERRRKVDFLRLRCHCCFEWLVVHIFEAFVVEISLWQNEADYPWGKHGQTHQLGTNSSWIEVLPRGNRDQIAFGKDSLSMVHHPLWSQIRDCWWRV